jgi:FtsZ-binding cell division protein ZapB
LNITDLEKLNEKYQHNAIASIALLEVRAAILKEQKEKTEESQRLVKELQEQVRSLSALLTK